MEIQDYPDGTPGAGDKVPFVADPGGTPALLLADVADLGGGGGGGITWTQVVNEPGTSLTNWTTTGGTWASTGGVYVCSANPGFIRHNTFVNYLVAVAEVEVLFPAGGGDRYAGIYAQYRAGTTQSGAQYFRVQRTGGAYYFEAARGGVGAVDTATLPGAADGTWIKIRVVMVGARAACYVDGVLKSVFDVAHDFATIFTALAAEGTAPISFRNVKVWTGDIGLPA